jgi:hypothetical protein
MVNVKWIAMMRNIMLSDMPEYKNFEFELLERGSLNIALNFTTIATRLRVYHRVKNV